METYYDYLRTYAPSLGSRIVEMYPPVQGPNDSIAAPISTLLRKPLPAQALTISGLAKTLKTARSVRIVGECGTGKTLMSMGVANAHADPAPYSAIAMCPPHLVLKWAREVLITVPRARAFVIYDLRNGGDPARPHGVAEVQLRNGHAVNKGMKTSLYEMRAMGRKGWRKRCPGPAYFIVSRETGKLSYHWKHAYEVAASGPDQGAVVNPDTRTTVPSSDAGTLCRHDFAAIKHSETVMRTNGGTALFSPLWQADREKIQRMAPLGYIGRFMKGWWDYAIADELHQLAQETAQGNNLGVLYRCAHKLIGLTGTLMGGYPTLYFYETGYSLHTLRQASRRSWRIGQKHPVKVKFLVSKNTTQATCLRLMGKKMLVALMMEGKFSGEGIHSLESDDDMMSAMARELVERGRVGESADAVWADLKHERDLHLPSGPAHGPQDTAAATEEEMAEMPLFLPPSVPDPPALTLVHAAAKPKQQPSPLWPTGHAEGKQMLLFA